MSVHGFGLYREDFSPKPAAAAFRDVLTRHAGNVQEPDPVLLPPLTDRERIMRTVAYVQATKQRDLKRKKLMELLTGVN